MGTSPDRPRRGASRGGTARRAALAGCALATVLACSRGSDRDAAPAPPGGVSVRGGDVVVTVGPEAQASAGIRTRALPATTERREVLGVGGVADPAALVALRGRYAAAQASAAGARAEARAAELEWRRVGALYRAGHATSARALETATARYRTATAAASAAAAPLQAVQAEAVGAWGPVAAGWIASGAPELDRLVTHRDVLVTVTLPPGVALATPPATAVVQAGGGPRVDARLVSEVPRTDPAIQGLTYLYLAPAAPTLVPGMSVAARLAAGAPVAGPVVPESAVVRWDGAAWIWVATGPSTFARRKISTDVPATSGGWVVPALPAGARVVVEGAQVLLSEQLRAATGATGGGGEDEDD